MKPVKTYSISVDGYGSGLYCARSPSKARARAYRDFLMCREVTFQDFLARSSLMRVANPPGVGDRIMVAGLPATRVYHPSAGHYVWFMRDDSDELICSHPAEVTSAALKSHH